MNQELASHRPIRLVLLAAPAAGLGKAPHFATSVTDVCDASPGARPCSVAIRLQLPHGRGADGVAAQKPLLSDPLSPPGGTGPATDPGLLARPPDCATSLHQRAN